MYARLSQAEWSHLCGHDDGDEDAHLLALFGLRLGGSVDTGVCARVYCTHPFSLTAPEWHLASGGLIKDWCDPLLPKNTSAFTVRLLCDVH